MEDRAFGSRKDRPGGVNTKRVFKEPCTNFKSLNRDSFPIGNAFTFLIY